MSVRVMRSSYPAGYNRQDPMKNFNNWAVFIKNQLMKVEYPKLKGGRK